MILNRENLSALKEKKRVIDENWFRESFSGGVLRGLLRWGVPRRNLGDPITKIKFLSH